jgi:hypothetical protein
MRRYNPSMLLAAAAIALASLPAAGAQTSIPVLPGHGLRHHPQPRQDRHDRSARLALAAERRWVRQRRNLRWAARGAIQLVNRS